MAREPRRCRNKETSTGEAPVPPQISRRWGIRDYIAAIEPAGEDAARRDHLAVVIEALLAEVCNQLGAVGELGALDEAIVAEKFEFSQRLGREFAMERGEEGVLRLDPLGVFFEFGQVEVIERRDVVQGFQQRNGLHLILEFQAGGGPVVRGDHRIVEDCLIQRQAIAGIGSAVLTVAIMVGMRDMVRTGYLSPVLRPGEMAVSAQWGVIGLFFVLFVAGLATLGWMLRKVAIAKVG